MKSKPRTRKGIQPKLPPKNSAEPVSILENLKNRRNQVSNLAEYWEGLTRYSLNDYGKQQVSKLLSKFSADEIYEAMRISVCLNGKLDEDLGRWTHDSIEESFKGIVRLCNHNRTTKNDPSLINLFKVRSYVRKKFGRINEQECIDILKAAKNEGVDTDTLFEIARAAYCWQSFKIRLEEKTAKTKAAQESKVALN